MQANHRSLQCLVVYTIFSVIFGHALLVSGFELTLLGKDLGMVLFSAVAFALTTWLAVRSYKDVLASLSTPSADSECQYDRSDIECQQAKHRNGIK
jgi:uncharacterized membrane protein